MSVHRLKKLPSSEPVSSFENQGVPLKTALLDTTLNLNSPKTHKTIVFPQQQNTEKLITRLQIECEGEKAHKQHLLQTFNAMKYIKTIRPADPSQLEAKKIILPKRKKTKKTLVFDLDETLVHCCSNINQADVIIDIKMPNGEFMKCGINIRPYVHECLLAANINYEIIIFTASHRCYADTVLDYLDPTHELIHHRLYRENCIVTDNLYIKDLRILDNRKIEDIVIVDNAAYSFAYQIDNGVPIISWYSDPNDKELFNLIEYLGVLSNFKDVRVANRRMFHLHTFYNDYLHEFTMENKENTVIVSQ
ncbi:hypothetical protein SteCoe_1581 [Stentor coeruleus]|uniref:FCP1 homology domain-containing protein n=1 Tax=Stentor coeruleus TaxID=5963 RepID=A0A1R2D1C3_9CILI|nr:hypothetical protein SteCoe_1581 [Stentor coeruleus]